jgi:hypothetical protein
MSVKLIRHDGRRYLVRLYFGRYGGLWLFPTIELWAAPATDSVGFKIVWLLWQLHLRVGKSEEDRQWWRGRH